MKIRQASSYVTLLVKTRGLEYDIIEYCNAVNKKALLQLMNKMVSFQSNPNFTWMQAELYPITICFRTMRRDLLARQFNIKISFRGIQFHSHQNLKVSRIGRVPLYQESLPRDSSLMFYLILVKRVVLKLFTRMKDSFH